MKKSYMILAIILFFSLSAFARQHGETGKNATRSPNSIIFSENFDGLTSLPAGWTDYTQDGWDMILAQNDEVIFFKQSTGVKTMILSTPLIDLTNASQLTFRFRSKLVVSTLKVGLMTDPSNPNTFQLLTQFQADTNMILYTVPLGTVSGSRYISFNWVGTYFKSSYLDDVIVYDNAVQNNVPSNVNNAVLTPGANGVYSGLLSWVNPSQEADGDPLTDLDSISVRLNGNYYTTILNPPIGVNQNISVTVPFPMMYSATLTPYNSAGEGIPNTTPEVWVGLDIPGAPTAVTLTQVGNLATLKWSPPKVGVHGGFFNGIITNYHIIRADNWQTDVSGTDSSLVMNITDPGTFNFQVIPENIIGSGPYGTSNTGVFLTGNYLLWEDFWVSVPAHLWSIQGENNYNWWLGHSNSAGGDEPELTFQSTTPYFFSYSRMVSPPLNTTGKSAVTLEFRHAHTAYGPYMLKVETSSDDGVTWHSGLIIPISATALAEEKSVVLTNADVGAANFRFAFTFEGSEANVESFSIDNVRLFPTMGIDVAANAIMLPEIIHPGDAVIPQAIIQNLGVDAVPYKAVCTIHGSNGNIYHDSLLTSIQPGAIDILSFANLVMPEGEFSSKVFVQCLSDNNPLNDTVHKDFVSYKTYQRSMVVLEDATGTWCTYCPGASMGIEDLMAHGYAVAAVAYHSGDTYQTPESRARINYYPAITGFPTVMFDGTLAYVGGNHSTSLYSSYVPMVEQRLAKVTPIKVSLGEMQVDNNILTAQVTIESLSPVRNSNLVVHAVLTESDIPEAWQDQTKLNEVERMMFADSSGTQVDLSDKSETVAMQFSLNPSWVKENLRLVVFVQDKVTREIFNGDIRKPAIGISEVTPSLMRIYPNPASETVNFPVLKDAKILLLDMTGSEVFSQENISGSFKLDVRHLKSGLYMVRISDDGKEYFAKIQVMH
ncbi:MAG: T9SS type A sorting domain-containing protein [Bacteroidota bacterium]